jgi:hypothetical protein
MTHTHTHLGHQHRSNEESNKNSVWEVGVGYFCDENYFHVKGWVSFKLFFWTDNVIPFFNNNKKTFSAKHWIKTQLNQTINFKYY